MSRKKHRAQAEFKVFNRQILLFVIFFIVLTSLSLLFFLKRETDVAAFFLVIGIMGLLGAFLTPVCYIFTPKKLTVVWLLPFRKTIPWGAINNIIEYKLFETVKGLPKYEIMYCQNYKGKTVVREIDLPRNRRTRSLMEKYAKHKLV